MFFDRFFCLFVFGFSFFPLSALFSFYLSSLFALCSLRRSLNHRIVVGEIASNDLERELFPVVEEEKKVENSATGSEMGGGGSEAKAGNVSEKDVEIAERKMENAETPTK